MNRTATGAFDVRMTPQPAASGTDPGLAHILLDKEYRGELSARGQGQMLSVMGSVQGSAGYVAIERVTGTLHGLHGSFALLHHGLMDKGRPSLRVDIVPDSGTGHLTGIAGSLDITIEGKDHTYVLEYSLPE